MIPQAPNTTETDTTIAYSSESSPQAAPPVGRAPLIQPGQAVGRRKEAITRVRLTPGKGTWIINGRSLESYFPNPLHQQRVKAPFHALGLEDTYDVRASIIGGGISGQAGSLRHAIARALNEIDRDNNRPPLKKAGFLTRDSRAVEPKKAGLKKARKAPQYSKR